MEIDLENTETKKLEFHKAESKNNLLDFKANYQKLKVKYSLPEYAFLNEHFEIELLCEVETDLLLRRIRKQINDKISANLRAMETLLNPQNAPMFIFSIVKSFSSDDKELISKMYKKFVEMEVEAFGLENCYNEKKEADYINKICKEWTSIAEDVDKIFLSMQKVSKSETKTSEKSYFG